MWASQYFRLKGLMIIGHTLAIIRNYYDVVVLKTGKTMKVLNETNLGASIYTTPVAKNGVLYIASRTTLFALENQ